MLPETTVIVSIDLWLLNSFEMSTVKCKKAPVSSNHFPFLQIILITFPALGDRLNIAKATIPAGMHTTNSRVEPTCKKDRSRLAPDAPLALRPAIKESGP